MNPFQPFTYAGCANPKKEYKFEPEGKYAYDVFYTLDGNPMTGHTRGNNQKDARINFYIGYEERAEIQHFQRYPIGW